MNLYEAIFVRKSVRKYIMKPLDATVLNNITEFAQNLPMLNEGLSIKYQLVDGINDYGQLSGLFHIKAPHYMLIYSTIDEGYGMNVGYVTEQISLYMTTKGIGSCYLGMAKPKKDEMFYEEHEFIIALAFGEGEREIYRTVDNAKRLPMEDVAIYREAVSSNVKSMLLAARMSPSSMNSQPWKFVVYENRIHVFSKKNIFLNSVLKELKDIDVGISIAHLLVAAEELWVDCKLHYYDNISSKTFKKYDYVTSLKMYY